MSLAEVIYKQIVKCMMIWQIYFKQIESFLTRIFFFFQKWEGGGVEIKNQNLLAVGNIPSWCYPCLAWESMPFNIMKPENFLVLTSLKEKNNLNRF